MYGFCLRFGSVLRWSACRSRCYLRCYGYLRFEHLGLQHHGSDGSNILQLDVACRSHRYFDDQLDFGNVCQHLRRWFHLRDSGERVRFGYSVLSDGIQDHRRACCSYDHDVAS